MTVSPNPASDRFQVAFTESDIAGSIEMVSAAGAVVISQSVLASPVGIDVHDIPNGAYFLRFTNGKESIISSCIIQH